MSLSLIIPVYNEENQVTNTIKTLLETGFFTDKLTAGKVSFFGKVLLFFSSMLSKWHVSYCLVVFC